MKTVWTIGMMLFIVGCVGNHEVSMKEGGRVNTILIIVTVTGALLAIFGSMGVE